MSKATDLECSLCKQRYAADQVQHLCSCGGPLLVRYDLEAIRGAWSPAQVREGPNSMWRYAPVLPPADESVVTLGEGMTPLIRARRLGARLGAQDLWIKDEGLNPTGSFKARGLACAVSMAVELGVKKMAIPSAGNAARRAAGELHRVPGVRRVRHAGGWADRRLREAGGGGRRGAWLVRRQHAEGALPDRGQEDHGVRGGRAARLAVAGRHLLSHRRRRGHDRDVEGVR